MSKQECLLKGTKSPARDLMKNFGAIAVAKKSIGIQMLVSSLLCRFKPNEVKFVFLGRGFDVYKNVPHLYMPVTFDSHKAAKAQIWIVNEIQEREYRQSEVKYPKLIVVVDESLVYEEAASIIRKKGSEVGVRLLIVKTISKQQVKNV